MRGGPYFALVGLAAVLFWEPFLGLGTLFHYDTWLQNLTFRAWWFEQLREGHFATWCPGMFGGYPLLAETQTGPLYPPTFILFSIFPATLAFSWSVVLHFALAGCGAFRLARDLGAGTVSALLAAVVFELSGYLVAHTVHFNLLTGAAWVPWALLAARSAWRGSVLAIFGLGGVWAALLLGAHPYATLMTGVLIVVALPVHTGLSLRRLASAGMRVAASVVIGLGLGAVQWIPARQLVERSSRGEAVDFSFLTFGSLPLANLPTLIAPDLFGSPVNGSYWAGPDWSHYAETILFVGTLPVLLAIYALVARRDRATTTLGVAGAVATLLMLGKYTPLYHVVSWIPVLQSTRLPGRFGLLFTLVVALLAALGLETLLRQRREESEARSVALRASGDPQARARAVRDHDVRAKRLRRLALLPLIPLAMIALVGAFAIVVPLAPGSEFAEIGNLWKTRLAAIQENASAVAFRSGVSLLVGVATYLLISLSTFRHRAWLAVLVVALDMFVWARSFNPTIPPAEVTVAPPVVGQLPNVHPRSRVFRQGVDEFWERLPGQPRADLFTPHWRGHLGSYATGAWALPPNSQLLYGVDSGEGFTSLLPSQWLAWMGLPDEPGATPRPDLTEAQADLLAIDAVISSGSGIAGEGWDPRPTPGGLWVSKNRDVFPRVRLARSWRVTSLEEIHRLVQSPTYDPRQGVLLEEPFPGLPATNSAGSSTIPLTAIERGPGHWEVTLPEGVEGIVVVSEAWDPDWQLTFSDGSRGVVQRAEGLFVAFEAPPSGGVVQLKHAPSSVKWGGSLSAGSLLLVAIGLGLVRKRTLASLEVEEPEPRWGRVSLGWGTLALAFVVIAASHILDWGEAHRETPRSRLQSMAIRSWVDEARAAHAAGAVAPAVSLLEAALQVESAPNLWFQLGLMQTQLGRDAAAVSSFRHVVDLEHASALAERAREEIRKLGGVVPN